MKNQLNRLIQAFYQICIFLVMACLMQPAQASDLAIYQAPNGGTVTLVMMLDTSGSMGDGNGYGSLTSVTTPVSSILGDYGFCTSSSGTVSCSSSSMSANVGACTVTNSGRNKNSFSTTTDPNNGYSFQLTIPAVTGSATVQAMPSYTVDYCPAPTAAIGALCAASAAALTSTTATLATGATAGGIGTYCMDRVSRLKMGMMAVLQATDSLLTPVYMGVGNFSSSEDGNITADGSTGEIIVPASATLGTVSASTTSQRYKLATAISKLTAWNGTPTAHAYAEAASYLLGTSTANTTGFIQQDAYEDVNTKKTVVVTTSTGAVTSSTTTSTDSYVTCNSLNGTTWSDVVTVPTTQTCYQWNSSGSSTQPSGSYGAETASVGTPSVKTTTSGSGTSKVTTTTTTTTTTTPYYQNISPSGFQHSINDNATYPGIVNSAQTAYSSPLPATAQSCDGQGIYVLSDGEPNDSDVYLSQHLMQAALGTSGSSFACSAGTLSDTGTTGLSGGSIASSGSAPWSCISAFAASLLNANSNPAGRSIKTAFVGFGTDFTNLKNGVTTSSLYQDAYNSCQWGARLKDQNGYTLTAVSPESNTCLYTASPNGSPAGLSATTPSNGIGTGGFYFAQSPSDVTASVKDFIQLISTTVLAALVTGSATVPVDSLNPNGYEDYGYFRMLAPNPGTTSTMLWNGNLKKYNIKNGALYDVTDNNLVLNANGSFATNTRDIWNPTTYNDGGNVIDASPTSPAGGTFDNIAGPLSTDSKHVFRPVFTNLDPTTGAALSNATTSNPSAVSMLNVPKANSSTTYTDASLLSLFTSTAPYKTGSPSLITTQMQLELLAFLGYNVTTTIPYTLPSSISAPLTQIKALGGTVHAQPIQVTYAGSLNTTTGALNTTRTESILYGSQEGALHLVDASTGKEQMVFIPYEILNNPIAVQALQPNAAYVAPTTIPTAVAPQSEVISPASGSTGFMQIPSQGVDGPWVADPNYNINRTTGNITAQSMNVYGGLRMSGTSYYGLDLSTATAPTFGFRIGADQTGKGFDRMGQSWSKPVLANIRYNGYILRVMIVGGGYDVCYENPLFQVSTSAGTNAGTGNLLSGTETTSKCNGLTKAAGNAVYMVSAIAQHGYAAGQLIWEASNAAPSGGIPSGADAVYNAYLVNSIVGQVSTLDRDGDGLIDHIYFADLGGQVFRADFNNASQLPVTTGSVSTAAFGVRVVRIGNLATSTLISAGTVPRFYEAPTVTIHDQAAGTSTPANKALTFIMVGVASGDRSVPLDVLPTASGGQGVTSPDNNVYGFIDNDFIRTDLITNTCYAGGGWTAATGCTSAALTSTDIALTSMQSNPQLFTDNVAGHFFPTTGTGKQGWYRDLGATYQGTVITSLTTSAGTTQTQTTGGRKAFEAPIAITGTLLVTVYNPQGVGITQADSCTPRVVGETDEEQFCLPYGACLTSSGTVDNGANGAELNTGARAATVSGGVVTQPGLLGSGIRGLTFSNNGSASSNTGTCTSVTIVGNTAGNGAWTCSRKLTPTRWYEKLPNPAKVR